MKNNWTLCITMILIFIASFGRAAFDHVGWKVWEIFIANDFIRERFAIEGMTSFMFLSMFALVGVWAAGSTLSADK